MSYNGGASANTGTVFWGLSNTGGNQQGNDFSIASNPTSRSIAIGTSTTYAIQTTLTAGAGETASLAVSNCPANTTCTLDNSSVSTNGGGGTVATLTVQTTRLDPDRDA